MFNRFGAASLALLVATLFTPAHAVAQHQTDPRSGLPSASHRPVGENSGNGHITGTVRTLDGHGIENARIEVRDSERGIEYSSGRTDSNGSFALYNISPGHYDVTAISGINEAHERVEVGPLSGGTSVDFRLANKPGSDSKTGDGSTVSLSQYQVPPKARSLYDKASQLIKHGKADEALEKVNAALAIFPKFSEALTLRGILEEGSGKPNEAIADLQKAVQYDANYAPAYIALASVLTSKARFDESLPMLTQAERLAPNVWQVYFEIARADIGKKDFAAALRNTDRASELQGGKKKESPEVHLIRGYALIGLNEYQKATHELEAFLAREPNGHAADAARKALDQLRDSTATATR